MINPLVSTLIKGMLYLILKAKQGGKYLSRKQVIDKRTGRKTWKYKYKPMQQRAAHEVTRGKFEKVTKLSGDEHKNQIEHALQNGIHVSLHVLRDYPDLAVKYHQQARLAKADKIREKVKASKVKKEVKVDDSKSQLKFQMPSTTPKEQSKFQKERNAPLEYEIVDTPENIKLIQATALKLRQEFADKHGLGQNLDGSWSNAYYNEDLYNDMATKLGVSKEQRDIKYKGSFQEDKIFDSHIYTVDRNAREQVGIKRNIELHKIFDRLVGVGTKIGQMKIGGKLYSGMKVGANGIDNGKIRFSSISPDTIISAAKAANNTIFERNGIVEKYNQEKEKVIKKERELILSGNYPLELPRDVKIKESVTSPHPVSDNREVENKKGIHTEGVQIIGNKAIKKITAANIREFDIYKKLQGINGIPKTEKESSNSFSMPNYLDVSNADTDDQEKRDDWKNTINNPEQIGRINDIINAISEKGIVYDDSLQFGYDGDNVFLLDFSNAKESTIKDAKESNLNSLQNFYSKYGMEAQANIIRDTQRILNLADSKMGKVVLSKDFPEIQIQSGDSIQNYPYIYYSTNSRPINNVIQTDFKNGRKIIFSKTKFDTQDEKTLNLTTISSIPKDQPNNFDTMQDYVDSQLAEAKETGLDVRNMVATLQDEYYAKLLENAHKEKIPVKAYESLRQDQKLHFDRKYPGMRGKTGSEIKAQSDYDASMSTYLKPSNFDTMPESKAAPAFKLEQEDLTSKEKNTRFNDAQGGLFGKKSTTHESYAKKDLKPALKLEGNETITSLVTAVKSALMSEGLDTRAREFVDKAFKEKDIDSVKKLASEYVEMKESVQVLKPAADDKGSEETKPMKTFSTKDLKISGSEKQIKYAKDLIKSRLTFGTFKEKDITDYIISELSKQAILLKEEKNGSVDAKYVINNSTPRNSFIADFALEYPKFHQFVLSKTESERTKQGIEKFYNEKYKLGAGITAKESYTDHAENAIQDTLEELGVDVSSVYANSEIENMDDEMKAKQVEAKIKISKFIESFMV